MLLTIVMIDFNIRVEIVRIVLNVIIKTSNSNIHFAYGFITSKIHIFSFYVVRNIEIDF